MQPKTMSLLSGCQRVKESNRKHRAGSMRVTNILLYCPGPVVATVSRDG